MKGLVIQALESAGVSAAIHKQRNIGNDVPILRPYCERDLFLVFHRRTPMTDFIIFSEILEIGKVIVG